MGHTKSSIVKKEINMIKKGTQSTNFKTQGMRSTHMTTLEPTSSSGRNFGKKMHSTNISSRVFGNTFQRGRHSLREERFRSDSLSQTLRLNQNSGLKDVESSTKKSGKINALTARKATVNPTTDQVPLNLKVKQSDNFFRASSIGQIYNDSHMEVPRQNPNLRSDQLIAQLNSHSSGQTQSNVVSQDHIQT